MKVTVIGASISGLFAAYLLAKEGLEVEVCERSAELGAPRRTLIVTDELGRVLGFEPKEAILNKLRFVEIFSESQSVKLELKRPDLVVERATLVYLLAELARSAGATIKLSRKFLKFEERASKLQVVIEDLSTGEIERFITDVLIGADGAHSFVSRAALGNGHRRDALLQARVPLPREACRDTFQVWFGGNHTRYFYWLIPETEETAALGLIAEDARQAGTGLKSFLAHRGLRSIEFQGAMVPRHSFKYAPEFDGRRQNVYLIGDAAAQVKMTTLGGVVTGLRGAKALAGAILKKKGWQAELLELKLELDLHLLLRRMFNHFRTEDYDTLVGLIRKRLRRVLSERTRDELAQTFLRLIIAEPRLMALGTKALLSSLLPNRHSG